ncbi:MAG: ATP-binding protein [Bacteroidales bacterium]|nr:ATP-binding protein [Bacteroidales bacterium]MCL2738482.1 ATP-binding protein [Bacteroidales bacterium]
MADFINRIIEAQVVESLKHNYVTAILGPRQCGKSTLARQIAKNFPDSIFIDLERNSDLARLEDAEWFLSLQRGKLICIDEIQRKPDLFPLLRSLTDEWDYNGAFLVLGSASRDLIKQSSETLAGRISYHTLTPFLWSEVESITDMEKYYAQGGFPRSLLTPAPSVSFRWRENFISTFLERDLMQWAGFSPPTMRKLWQMLAHTHGETTNLSMFAKSLGVSDTTVKNYIDLLQETFMVVSLPPYISNLGKRLVRSPKIYIADSGITAALLGLRDFTRIAGHPVSGSLWEQMVLTNLKGAFEEAEFFFYRTAGGAEMDIVMKYYDKVIAIECKSTYSPSLSKGNHHAIEDINPIMTFIAAPVASGWPLKPKIEVVSLTELIIKIKEIIT